MRRSVFPLLLLVLGGCSSDHALQPIHVTPPSMVDFTTPDSTLASLVRAVHDRDITSYGLCFADTLLEHREFHASFDHSDTVDYLASHAGPIGPWRRPEELAFFPGFVALGPDFFYDTEFTVDDDRGGIVNVGGPSALQIWNVRYRVLAGATPVVAGAAVLRFERLGLAREFKITYWEDRRDTSSAITWGKRRLDSL